MFQRFLLISVVTATSMVAQAAPLAAPRPIPRASRAPLDVTTEAEARRDEQIRSILAVLAGNVDATTRAELTFRLSDLYWQKSRVQAAREFADYDARMEAWVRSGRRGPEPRLHKRESEALLRQALHGYQTLLDKHPDYARRDEVLYLTATTLEEVGQKDAAMRRYLELVKQHPESGWTADAYLALGEHYFNANDVLKARAAFQRAHQRHKPGVSEYALYKLAWCDYNLQEYESAIEKLVTLVDHGKGADGARVRLSQEALQDLALTFTHVQAVDRAWTTFSSRAGEERARELMVRMAGLYLEQGQYPLARETWTLLLKQRPLDARAPEYHAGILTTLHKEGRRDELRALATELPRLYAAGTTWRKRNHDKTERGLTVLEDRLREATTETHQAWTKVKKDEDAQLALALYAAWHDTFPDEPQAARMHFFRAELLYDVKRYAESAAHYELALRDDGAALSNDLRRPAAYHAILAHERVVDAESGRVPTRVAPVDPGAPNRSEELTAAERLLAGACDRYVGMIPLDARMTREERDDVVLVKYKAAALYHRRHQYAESAHRFEQLVDRWPDHPQARRAADAMLDGLAFRRMWPELGRTARKLQQNRALTRDPAFAATLAGYVEGSSFNEALALHERSTTLEAQGDGAAASSLRRDAAARFVAHHREFPGGKYADRALFNAVMLFDDENMLDESSRHGELFLKQHANTEWTARVAWRVATMYERMADLERAAQHYEQFATRYPNAVQSPDALFNAAVLRQGMGQRQAAATLLERYLRLHGDRADAADAYWRMARILDEDGEFARAARLYHEFESRFPHAPAERVLESRHLHAVALMHEERTRAEGLRQCEQVLARASRMSKALRAEPSVRRASAHCHFELTERRYQEYVTIRLEGDNARLASQLQRKANALRALQREYEAVVAYGDGTWAVAALYRVGAIHQDFSLAIKDSPDPRGLTPEQRELYRAELEAQTFAVDEKAVAALETAIAKAFELGIYTDWTWRAQEALRVYRPQEFPAAHRMGFAYSDVSRPPVR
ncbi:MAG: tetratricopeptide repeat protein [Myxococcota bacterium]